MKKRAVGVYEDSLGPLLATVVVVGVLLVTLYAALSDLMLRSGMALGWLL